MEKTFNKKNLLELRKMSIEEVRQYYMAFRRYEYEIDAPIKWMDLKRRLHFLVSLILKIDKILNFRTAVVLGDKRIKTKKPVIYACTHIGRYDIESAIERIGEQAWFIMGDPGETYRNLNGVILRLNGVSWFEMGEDEACKFDAHTVNVRQTKILKAGGKELCFPEAAWNVDPIKPVGDLNPGVVKRAIRSGAEIVPVAIEQYRGKHIKHYYLNFGKNIDLSGAKIELAEQLSEQLREDMAGLKWEIWEKKGNTARIELPESWEDGFEQFIDSIMCDTENGYTLEEIERTKYKKNILSDEFIANPDEVFEYLEHLIPNKNNAFLFRSINSNEVRRNSKVLKKI